VYGPSATSSPASSPTTARRTTGSCPSTRTACIVPPLATAVAVVLPGTASRIHAKPSRSTWLRTRAAESRPLLLRLRALRRLYLPGGTRLCAPDRRWRDMGHLAHLRVSTLVKNPVIAFSRLAMASLSFQSKSKAWLRRSCSGSSNSQMMQTVHLVQPAPSQRDHSDLLCSSYRGRLPWSAFGD
jgi:hypothetical protein